METSPYRINKQKEIYPVGIGWPILARDIDREEFIDMCGRTSTIILLTTTGESYQSVKVAKSVFNKLNFPAEEYDLGTPVIFLRDQVTGFPIVIGALFEEGELQDLGEYQFSLSKKLGNTEIGLWGNTELKSILLGAKGGEGSDLNLKSDDLLFISSISQNIEAKESLTSIQNKIKTRIKKIGEDAETVSEYELGKGYNLKDEFGNEIEINKDHIKFKGKKFVQEVENYSMKELMQDVVDAMSKIIIATSLGNQSPLNMQQILELKNKINQIFE